MSDMSKIEMVRAAVKALGIKAKAKEVAARLKEDYNLELTDGTLNNYLTTARKELKESNGESPALFVPSDAAAPVEANGTVATLPEGAPPVVRPVVAGPSLDDLLTCMKQMRGIVNKLGQSGARKLLDSMT